MGSLPSFLLVCVSLCVFVFGGQEIAYKEKRSGDARDSWYMREGFQGLLEEGVGKYYAPGEAPIGDAGACAPKDNAKDDGSGKDDMPTAAAEGKEDGSHKDREDRRKEDRDRNSKGDRDQNPKEGRTHKEDRSSSRDDPGSSSREDRPAKARIYVCVYVWRDMLWKRRVFVSLMDGLVIHGFLRVANKSFLENTVV